MPQAVSSSPLSPLERALLADSGIPAGNVDLTIDARDEMLGFLVQSHAGDRERARYAYFQSGASIAGAMAQVLRWRFGGLPGTVEVLDFASGYGRVTRFLLSFLPAERLWVSDVYADGVRFQEQRFGVHGIVSRVLPEQFAQDVDQTGQRFDAILVTSLFTHLSAERFVAWLGVLMGLLAPGGVLAFSVHDRSLLPPGVELPESGLLFQAISESGSLAGEDYGSSWASEDFVRGALRRALAPGAPGDLGVPGGAGGSGTLGSLHRLPRGLCNFQDLYVAVAEGNADFTSLRFHNEPQFFVERCAVTVGSGSDLGECLELQGWAVQRGGRLAAVEALLDDELLARFPIEVQRPEVAEMLGDPGMARAGWAGTCRLPAAASRAAAVLRLRAVDDQGTTFSLVASSLAGALHDSTRNEVSVLHRELRQAQAGAARLAEHAAELRARIAAMEASRFWKLRNQWFRCKAALGIGNG